MNTSSTATTANRFTLAPATTFTNSVALCERFKGLLNTAQAAVEQLALRGICPRAICLGGDRPVIQIDTPLSEPWMRGAMRLRSKKGERTHTVMAAPFHGCRLEWEVVGGF